MGSALARKRWRDFWKMRGRVLALALVIAAGVALYIMASLTCLALDRTRERLLPGAGFRRAFCQPQTRAPEPA